MCKSGVRRAAPWAAAMLLSFLVGCQPEARSEAKMQMTAPPRTTAVERTARPADPLPAAPPQAKSPTVAPVAPAKPVDADSVEDRHPSRWPKKLRAKFAMVVDY